MASEGIPTVHRDSDRKPLSRFRLLVAIFLAVIALGYAVGIVLGYVPESRRIDGATLALIAVVLLAILVALRPDLADRFKGFEMSGFKVEMLEKVRERLESRLSTSLLNIYIVALYALAQLSDSSGRHPHF